MRLRIPQIISFHPHICTFEHLFVVTKENMTMTKRFVVAVKQLKKKTTHSHGVEICMRSSDTYQTTNDETTHNNDA